MNSFRYQIQKYLLEATAWFIAYHGISEWLLRKNIVSLIFAAGPEAGWFKMALAAGFIILRPLIILYLPAMLITRITLAILDKYGERRPL